MVALHLLPCFRRTLQMNKGSKSKITVPVDTFDISYLELAAITHIFQCQFAMQGVVPAVERSTVLLL